VLVGKNIERRNEVLKISEVIRSEEE